MSDSPTTTFGLAVSRRQKLPPPSLGHQSSAVGACGSVYFPFPSLGCTHCTLRSCFQAMKTKGPHDFAGSGLSPQTMPDIRIYICSAKL